MFFNIASAYMLNISLLRKINFYKRLLYGSDVFIHNMFCTFLYNNCDDGILFKSVFYRKSDAIHSVWSAFHGLCSMVVCISVILLLVYFYFPVCLVAWFGE